jgi:hypothetical protein
VFSHGIYPKPLVEKRGDTIVAWCAYAEVGVTLIAPTYADPKALLTSPNGKSGFCDIRVRTLRYFYPSHDYNGAFQFFIRAATVRERFSFLSEPRP